MRCYNFTRFENRRSKKICNITSTPTVFLFTVFTVFTVFLLKIMMKASPTKGGKYRLQKKINGTRFSSLVQFVVIMLSCSFQTK